MYKDIIFSSFTAVPSDYECQDGTLAQCHNLINEDGACHAVQVRGLLWWHTVKAFKKIRPAARYCRFLKGERKCSSVAISMSSYTRGATVMPPVSSVSFLKSNWSAERTTTPGRTPHNPHPAMMTDHFDAVCQQRDFTGSSQLTRI